MPNNSGRTGFKYPGRPVGGQIWRGRPLLHRWGSFCSAAVAPTISPCLRRHVRCGTRAPAAWRTYTLCYTLVPRGWESGLRACRILLYGKLPMVRLTGRNPARKPDPLPGSIVCNMVVASTCTCGLPSSRAIAYLELGRLPWVAETLHLVCRGSLRNGTSCK